MPKKICICTKCGAIGIGEEFIGTKCTECETELVELTARSLLIAKASIYGYEIFEPGDECPNCHHHDVQRMLPPTEGGPSRLCRKCNAMWSVKLKES